MKLKILLPFIVAIALGGAAIYIGKDLVRDKLTGATTADAIGVVTAARGLEPGRAIQPSDIKLTAMPRGSVPVGAIRRIDDAAGRVVGVQLLEGQIVLDGSLLARSAGAGLQGMVPKGMRAVTIEVSDLSGGAMLTAGCRVDVICAFVDEVTRQSVAKTVIENAKVTQVHTQSGGRPGSEGTARSVTLVVSAKEAISLELAASKSRPRIVLRGYGDDDATPAGMITVAEMAGHDLEELKRLRNPEPASQPAPPPPATKPVEVAVAPPPPPPPPPPPATLPATAPAEKPVDTRHLVHIIRGSAETTAAVEKSPTPATQPQRGPDSMAGGNGSSVER